MPKDDWNIEHPIGKVRRFWKVPGPGPLGRMFGRDRTLERMGHVRGPTEMEVFLSRSGLGAKRKPIHAKSEPELLLVQQGLISATLPSFTSSCKELVEPLFLPVLNSADACTTCNLRCVGVSRRRKVQCVGKQSTFILLACTS